MSTTYPGGFITKSPPAPNGVTAQGIWTLDQAMQYMKTPNWPLQRSFPVGVDLDGTNDYLSRASDLTGNADGKTFTFSAWVWLPYNVSSCSLYGSDGTLNYLLIESNSGQYRTYFALANASGTNIFFATGVLGTISAGTWNHVLISCDLTNTSNRSIYINDVAQSVTWTTYTNDTIDWTRTAHYVGSYNAGSAKVTGRLAHVYLDYTYRDLSNSTNRRLFITADRKPASGQAALNPILYLSMDDPSTAHVNQGTGGNFTLNGTIARSGRGPNQYNTPYSDLDGAADYLSRTTVPTGITDSGTFTLHFCFSPDSLASTGYVCTFTGGGSNFFYCFVTSTGITLDGRNSSGTTILSAETNATTFVVGRNYVISVSIDLSNSAKRHVYINGASASMNWATYTNASINFDTGASPVYYVGRDSGTAYLNGKLGDVFFHTSYIDLSNAANLAKFVTGTGIDAKPVDLGSDGSTPLGVQPLIYLPMYGNNAGKNYGSGGDFTVNSGPYTGARGPSEFWGNKADFDGSTGRLSKSTSLGISDGKIASGAFWFNSDSVTGARTFFRQNDGTGGARGFIVYLNGSALTFVGANSSGTDVLRIVSNTTISTGTDYFIQYCFDLTDTGKRFIYINNVASSLTVTTYTNADMNLSAVASEIGDAFASNYYDGKLSEFFFTTEYIDFSQEANRLKFRDAFGNPVSLGADGSTPTGTAPAIYMRFDPAAQGTNSGTGGTFTKSGTIADGGQL